MRETVISVKVYVSDDRDVKMMKDDLQDILEEWGYRYNIRSDQITDDIPS